MTLREIIDSRGSKYDTDILNQVSMAEFWQGYQHGWKMAYQDLREILDQHGFDKNVIVIKEKNVVLRDYKITFKTYDEANKILTQLNQIGYLYGCVLVTDLYDLCEMEAPFEERRNGWVHSTMNEAKVVYNGNSEYYYIDLPRPTPMIFD